jgi:FKBP-type peptidyl-prolyl cis-trans isomerase SlyD
MDITSPCVVTLTWRLSDGQGQLIDELSEPVEFFYGGEDLLPKVEEALAGQGVGFEAELHLEPEHAFGDYDAELLCYEARALFPRAWSRACASKACPKAPSPPTCPRT